MHTSVTLLKIIYGGLFSRLSSNEPNPVPWDMQSLRKRNSDCELVVSFKTIVFYCQSNEIYKHFSFFVVATCDSICLFCTFRILNNTMPKICCVPIIGEASSCVGCCCVLGGDRLIFGRNDAHIGAVCQVC